MDETPRNVVGQPVPNELVHAATAELMNVVALIECAIESVPQESAADGINIHDDSSRTTAVLGMSRRMLTDVVNKLSAYI